MGSFRPVKKLTVGTYYSHFVNKTGYMGQPANYSKDLGRFRALRL